MDLQILILDHTIGCVRSSRILFLINIPMKHLRKSMICLKNGREALHHRHGAMFTAGTPHGHRQNRSLPLNVLTYQKKQKRFNQSKKPFAGITVKHITCDIRFQTGEGTEFRYPERVGKKADIPDQISCQVLMLKSEGG